MFQDEIRDTGTGLLKGVASSSETYFTRHQLQFPLNVKESRNGPGVAQKVPGDFTTFGTRRR
jgi:hypothetical protein